MTSADDGIPFEVKMRQFIQREFASELGASLLEADDGLETIATAFSPPSVTIDPERDAA